jgi:hypothetical protein
VAGNNQVEIGVEVSLKLIHSREVVLDGEAPSLDEAVDEGDVDVDS